MNAQATPLKKSAKPQALPVQDATLNPVERSTPNMGLLNDASDMLGQTHQMLLAITALLSAARVGEAIMCEQLVTLLRPIECNLYAADDLLTQALDFDDAPPLPSRQPISLT